MKYLGLQPVFNLDAGGGGGGGGSPAAGGGSPAGGSPAPAAGGTPAAPAAPAAAPKSLSDAADAAARAAGADPAAPGGSDKGGIPDGPYYPEGIFEQLKGKDERETIDKLWGEVKGRPRAPNSPDEYKLELPEALAQKAGDLSDDEVLPIWRKVAHKLGLDNKTFNGAFVELYNEMESAGLIDHGPDYAAEAKKLEPKTGDQKARAIEVRRRINDAQTFVKGLESNGALSKTQAAILHGITESADGVMTIEAIMQLANRPGLVNGGSPAGNYTWSDAERDMGDERYSTTSAKYDPAFRRATDDKMAKLPRRKLQMNGRLA